MEAPVGEALERLRRDLSVDERGVLLLEGVPTLVVPVKAFMHMQLTSERILGRGFSAIIYLAGEAMGHEVARLVLEQTRGRIPPPALLEMIGVEGGARGFGFMEVASMDWASGRGRLRVTCSPYALAAGKADQPVCTFSAGVYAGIVHRLGGREVQAREASCAAVEGDYCEFEITPAAV